MEGKELIKTIEELFETTVKPRKMVAYTGCKTHGIINIMEIHCDDPECRPCSAFMEAIKAEAQKWVSDEQN